MTLYYASNKPSCIMLIAHKNMHDSCDLSFYLQLRVTVFPSLRRKLVQNVYYKITF